MGIVFCPVIAVLVLVLATMGTKGQERRLLQQGFVAHVVGTAAIVAYHTWFTSGDMLGYAFYGRQLARLIELDVSYYLPEVVKLALHFDTNLPPLGSYDSPGATEYLTGMAPTKTMFALSGLVMMIVGTTLFAASLIFSLYAYLGSAFFYTRIKPALLEHERIPVLKAMMFVPSVVFWSSGIVKEAVLLGSLGFLCGGLYRVLSERRVSSLVFVAIGATGIGIVKPYAIFPLALAVAAWFDASRRHSYGWATRIGAVLLAFLGLVALSQIFPQYAMDRLGEEVARQQSAGQATNYAGSYIDFGAPEERSMAGQLRFLPLALINSLARPFLVEARNPSQIMAAIETTIAVIIVISLIRRHGVRELYRRVASRPPMVAALAFILAFGAAVGLATTNLGTLSRYRLPMVPLYAGLLLALRINPKTVKKPAVTGTTKPKASSPIGRRLPARRPLGPAGARRPVLRSPGSR